MALKWLEWPSDMYQGFGSIKLEFHRVLVDLQIPVIVWCSLILVLPSIGGVEGPAKIIWKKVLQSGLS